MADSALALRLPSKKRNLLTKKKLKEMQQIVYHVTIHGIEINFTVNSVGILIRLIDAIVFSVFFFFFNSTWAFGASVPLTSERACV